MSKIYSLLLVLVGLVGLAACGPVIETRYDFRPPASAAGMQCVQNCQYEQSACQDHTRRQMEDCRHQAERRAEREYRRRMDDYVHDLKRYSRNPDKHKEPREPYRPQPEYYLCNSAPNDCLSLYHACYRSCGGEVFEHQVCTANCDQQ